LAKPVEFLWRGNQLLELLANIEYFRSQADDLCIGLFARMRHRQTKEKQGRSEALASRRIRRSILRRAQLAIFSNRRNGALHRL
jgi:hypothetical protein